MTKKETISPKTTEENLTDTVIKLTDTERKFLQNFIDRRMSAEIAFEVASDNIRAARNDLWKAIFDFYPEIENYHSNYNSKQGEIHIVGKKREIKD